MFNSIEATDGRELHKSKDIELKKYFLPSIFCLISSDGQKYGPFGTDSLGRKPFTIQIDNGDVLAQATSSFIYDGGEKTFKNDKSVFSFYVSNETLIPGVTHVSWARSIEIQ